MLLFEQPINNSWKLSQKVINGITQIAYLNSRDPQELANQILSDWILENEKKPDATFEWFWSTYGKSRGKEKAMILWGRLGVRQKEKIYEHLPEYVKSTPDKQFRADPCTYLNQKKYNDEIIFQEEKKEKSEFPDFYNFKLVQSLSSQDYQRYKKHLESKGFQFGSGSGGAWVRDPKKGIVWL